MIVLDENILGEVVVKGLQTWYKGKVASINEFRSDTVVKDDAVPTLLRTVKQPTFLTTNVSDYWGKMPAHPAYCIICFNLPNERILEIPRLLRMVLRFAEFKTKAARMGRIIQIKHHRIEYYSVDSKSTFMLNWPAM